MRYALDGPWRKGFALDLHTLASTYLGPDEHGHDRFETKRSELGELLYRLKYRQDRDAVPEILKVLDGIRGIERFDAIVPVPSTNRARRIQPVETIARALGQRRSVPVLSNMLTIESGGPELKEVSEPTERIRLLRRRVRATSEPWVQGRRLLLLDDLYRSGATLEVCTRILYDDLGAADVCALTLTKTRTRQ